MVLPENIKCVEIFLHFVE